MRPRLFTIRNLILALLAVGIFGGLAYWGSLGFPLPGADVPSTAGKLVFVSDRDGSPDLFLADAKEGATAVSLTSGPMKDGEPAFTGDGQMVVFTSNRQRDTLGGFKEGVVRQLFILQAAAGKPVSQLTQSSASSGTKEAPMVAAGDRVYFLDSGKIASIDIDASDPVSVFPDVTQKRGNPLIGELFERGGVIDFSVSADGNWAAAVVKREDDQVLVAYDIQSKTPAVVAAGRKIRCRFVADGTLTAAIADGTPFQQPVPLDNETAAKVPSLAAIVPSSAGVVEGKNVFVRIRFGATYEIVGLNDLPFEADGFLPSPDGRKVAIYAAGKKFAGLLLAPLEGGGDALPLSDLPVESVSFSPDSAKVAFAAAGDIWLAPTDGSAHAVNVTGGKGKNRAPVFSPALK